MVSHGLLVAPSAVQDEEDIHVLIEEANTIYYIYIYFNMVENLSRDRKYKTIPTGSQER